MMGNPGALNQQRLSGECQFNDYGLTPAKRTDPRFHRQVSGEEDFDC